MRRNAWVAALLTVGISCDACAAITTDSSLGQPAQALAGPNYLIPETLGKLSGSNLFHSFQTFNILTGESANFTTATSGIANVISRVTGGSLSQINGLLKLTPASGAPAFFFINPAGITFGAGASIDVPGAFHVSTADYIKFPDGNLHADLNQASTFSSAPPEAFGFLGTTRAPVTVNGGAALSTKPLQPISVVGGDVVIDNGTVSTLDGGDIRVVAVGQSAQEIGFTGTLPAANGNLSILNDGIITASTGTATDGGSVNVGAGNISVDGGIGYSSISSEANAGNGNAGSVEVSAAGSLSVINGASIFSRTWSSGAAGAVKVNAGSIILDGQGFYGNIFSNAKTGSTGNAGSVEVTSAGSLSLVNGAFISSEIWSSGNAGSVKVNADSISIDSQGSSEPTGIGSAANTGSTGNAGSVEVTATGNLSVANGGTINSDTYSSGNANNVSINAATLLVDGSSNIGALADVGSSGQTGNVVVNATGSITLSNGGRLSIQNKATVADPDILTQTLLKVTAPTITINSGLVTTGTSGNVTASNVEVSATGNLSIVNNGLIISSTMSSGSAGSIKVNADSIAIDKQGGNSYTGIWNATTSTGSAGSIEAAAAGNFSIVNGGFISSETYSSGYANNVSVRAGTLLVDGGSSRIGALAAVGSSGQAGNVNVDATNSITLSNGGEFSIQNKANAADPSILTQTLLTVTAPSITLNGGQINATTSGNVNAGNVDISATGHLSIVNGGAISSNTSSSGNASFVKVNADSISIDGQGFTGFTGVASDTNTGSSGYAGSVEVTASGNLSIVNGGVISSDTFSSGNAGAIKVNAGSITIDRQGNNTFTGITSSANQGTGNAGSIEVSATGNLSIVNGGGIISDTNTSGKADSVKVNAGSINIDSQGSSEFTGISSSAIQGTGNAGNVEVAASGNLSIVNAGVISSDTQTSGNSGSVKVNAGNISIDSQGGAFTGISSTAIQGTGSAGNVEVTTTGSLSLVNGGAITSDTQSSGNAGTVRVNAGSINIEQGNSLLRTGITSLAVQGSAGYAGNVEVTAAGNLSIVNGGAIASDTFSLLGNAGSVKVNAGAITIDMHGGNTYAGISSTAHPGAGNAGSVEVTAAGSLSIINGGQINSDTYSSGAAGSVKVNAGSIYIDNQGSHSYTGIYSDANADAGNAGSVDVTAAGSLSIVNGGVISSSTSTSGNAGAIKVNAGSITIDRQGSTFTGIQDIAQPGSTGHAGTIEVTAAGNLSIVNGGVINSDTYSSGSAGAVKVNADSISIDGWGIGYFTGITSSANQGTGNAGSVEVTAASNLSVVDGGGISSISATSGNAGSVKINAGSITIDGQGSVNFTGITSAANPGSTGNAGRVDVSTDGSISLTHGGAITSDTYSAGNAGSVWINAGSIAIDGQGRATGISSDANIGSTGNAGSISVTTTGNLSIADFGGISSSTYALGKAGAVSVNAGSIAIDGKGNLGHTGIASDAREGSAGNAGTVDVTAQGALSITRAGAISSTTFGAGNAGAVVVSGSTLLVDGAGSGIYAAALAGTSGQTGNVVVTASDNLTISNGGGINIGNLATVAAPALLTPTSISVTAPRIIILNSPNAITTSSTGNIAAGSIDIRASDNLYIDPSGITTTSNLGNGGAINIQAGMLSLINSQIATSVAGLTGNGGNITIASSTLILNTGFIMANTAAANAIGGTVSIAAQNLIPSGNTLFIGGSTPYTYQPGVFGFNVIQAAAPTGVSGTVQTTSPALDVSGSLSGLNTQVIDTGGLSRSPCQATGGSSMAQSGRGGLPPSARGLLRAELNLSPINSSNHASAGADNMRVALSNWGCS